MTKCPCCGSHVDVKLPLVDLDLNTISWNDKTVRVGGNIAEMMHAFNERGIGRLAQPDYLISKVWGWNSDVSRVNMQVHVLKLRKVLKHLGGWRITLVHGDGYVLERLETL